MHGDVHAWKDARQVNTLKRLGTRRAQWEAAQASGAPADGTTPMVVNAADMVGHLHAGVATPAYMCVGEGSLGPPATVAAAVPLFDGRVLIRAAVTAAAQ